MSSLVSISRITPVVLLLLVPRLAQAQTRWASVSVGFDHVCALDAAGRAFCFGYNHSAQLGGHTPQKCGIIGESGATGCYPTASERTPVLAANGMRFASISAGEYVTCAIDPQQRAWCWGDPMGDPASYRDGCLRGRPCSYSPVPLDPARRYAAMDARSRCFAATDGSARCWGTRHGEGGDVSTPWSVSVAAVSGDPEYNARTFCAVARNGRAYCQGEAAYGVPGTQVSGGPVELAAPLAQVAVQYTWVCALDRVGQAYCWGAAASADPHGGDARPGFELCNRYGSPTRCVRTPQPVTGGARYRSITPMARSTMPVIHEVVGLTADGRAFVWGEDRVARPWRPEHRWASVSGGRWGHCGVTTAGELFCWGENPHEAVQGRVPHP